LISDNMLPYCFLLKTSHTLSYSAQRRSALSKKVEEKPMVLLYTIT
jgi:hypothetical protein